jgi:hypothetical protein
MEHDAFRYHLGTRPLLTDIADMMKEVPFGGPQCNDMLTLAAEDDFRLLSLLRTFSQRCHVITASWNISEREGVSRSFLAC